MSYYEMPISKTYPLTVAATAPAGRELAVNCTVAGNLTVHFSGDLGKPEEVVVEAQLNAEKIRRGRYTLASLALSAVLQNNVMAITQKLSCKFRVSWSYLILKPSVIESVSKHTQSMILGVLN